MAVLGRPPVRPASKSSSIIRLKQLACYSMDIHMKVRDLSLAELARQCVTSRASSTWTELIERLQPVFARVAYRVAREWGQGDPSEIDDVVQEIFLKLAGMEAGKLNLSPLSDDASARAYFQVMAANASRDYFRQKYAAKRGEGKTDKPGDRLDELKTAVTTAVDTEKQILLGEIDRALPPEPNERLVFWLYYTCGLSSKEIAAMPAFGLSAKGVESLLFRLAAKVRRELRLARPSDLLEGKATPEAF